MITESPASSTLTGAEPRSVSLAGGPGRGSGHGDAIPVDHGGLGSQGVRAGDCLCRGLADMADHGGDVEVGEHGRDRPGGWIPAADLSDGICGRPGGCWARRGQGHLVARREEVVCCQAGLDACDVCCVGWEGQVA